jgi:hypothetical protein
MTSRIGYPHLVSTLALLVALAGGGIATAGAAPELAKKLPKNSVTTKQIKNGTIRAQDIAAGSITGALVADGSLTGADIDESSLGKVPAAASVDDVTVASAALAITDPPKTLAVIGPITLQALCFDAVGGALLWLRMSTTTDNASYVTSGGSSDKDVDVADGPVTVYAAHNGVQGVNAVVRGGGRTAVLSGVLVADLASCTVDLSVLG